MTKQVKPTQSEIDGVQYRKAKLWQIILYACNGLVGMSIYSLIGMASYSASIGYGISTIAVGVHPHRHPYSGRRHRPAASLPV